MSWIGYFLTVLYSERHKESEMFRKSLLVAGVIGTLATGAQAVNLKLDFGREGSPAVATGYSAYETDRLNPTAPGPYVRTFGIHNVTLSGREASIDTTPGFRSDNRSAGSVPVAFTTELFQDVVRLQGTVAGVQVGNTPELIPVIEVTIDNLAANTAYNIGIGGFDAGGSWASYNYLVNAINGTTGSSTNYGFSVNELGDIYGDPADPSENSIWTGSTTFTTDGSGVMSFEIVYDSANFSGGADDITFLSFLTVVPEPASLSLLGLGGLAMLGRRRRQSVNG